MLKMLEDGPKDAPIVCFIHGWPDRPALWQAQVDALSDRYRCIRFELPNYDPERKPRLSFAGVTEAMIRSIEAVLTDSTEKQVILVGHDWGAYFSYQVEAARPDLIKRMVTMDVGAILKPETWFQTLAIISYQWTLVFAFYLGHVLPWFGTQISKAVARSVKAPASATAHWRMNYLYVNYWSQFLFGGQPKPKIYPDAPLMYLYGVRKPFMFHMQGWLEKLRTYPKNKVLGLADSGHWLMLDETSHVNELLASWFESTEQP